MADDNILSRIDELVAEEHELRAAGHHTDEDRARLAQLERDLDQCWDLMRRRQAARDNGRDPNSVDPRPESEVESYWQ